MKHQYAFCHGYGINPYDFTEVTCRFRERCPYYDVDFYRKYGDRLNEFDELFPFMPCSFYKLGTATRNNNEKPNSFAV